MAVKNGPNSTRRKADARKRGKCQLCGAKVAPGKGKSVVVDPPGVGEVKVVKAREGKSFWCADCAGKKSNSYERAIERKLEEGSPKRKAKPKAGRKPAAKSSTRSTKRTAAKKATGRKTTKRTGRKAKASSAADPF